MSPGALATLERLIVAEPDLCGKSSSRERLELLACHPRPIEELAERERS
jgi:hypothetical protein